MDDAIAIRASVLLLIPAAVTIAVREKIQRAGEPALRRSSRLILASASTRAGAIGRIRDRIELAAHPGDKISKRVRVGPGQPGNALRLSRLRLRLHAL
jgi:hypothetical protein